LISLYHADGIATASGAWTEANRKAIFLDCFRLRLRNDDTTITVNKVSSLRDFVWVAYFRMLKHTVNKVSSLRDLTVRIRMRAG
jgi:hypothetical protein